MSTITTQDSKLGSLQQYLPNNQTTDAKIDFTSVLASENSTQKIRTATDTVSDQSLLDLNVPDPFYRPDKPSVKEFMDASKSSFEDAVEIIYGVIGSNADYRDWKKIMASSDPMAEARKATGQNYSTNINVKNQTASGGALGDKATKIGDNLYKNTDGSYAITASDGTALTTISPYYGSWENVVSAAGRFGLDISGSFQKNMGNADDVENGGSLSLATTTYAPLTQTKTVGESAANNASAPILDNSKNTANDVDELNKILSGYLTQQSSKTIADTQSVFSALQKLFKEIEESNSFGATKKSDA